MALAKPVIKYQRLPFCPLSLHVVFNITLLGRTPAEPLSAILRPPGQKAALSLPETPENAPDDFYAGA